MRSLLALRECVYGVLRAYAVHRFKTIFLAALGGVALMAATYGNAGEVMAAATSSTLPIGRNIPGFGGAIAWLNSPPLTPQLLRGKVVVVNFWTYTCINSLRSLPDLRAWEKTYAARGLVVIGIHTPEFSFEHDLANVRHETKALKVAYPVAVDSNYAIWNAFGNQYWPATYVIDAEGRVRYHFDGEGGAHATEAAIRQLLAENGTKVRGSTASVEAKGFGLPADFPDDVTPETYIGFAQAANFASREREFRNRPHAYVVPAILRQNQWGLDGRWTIGAEYATLDSHSGRIIVRFHARDLQLVMSPSPSGRPIRFRVMIDGRIAGADRGLDSDSQGVGTVTEPRLYQLVRQRGKIVDRTCSIQFYDLGVRAFDITFG
jgi:thiol-disulfide isomerase/thioredoxin